MTAHGRVFEVAAYFKDFAARKQLCLAPLANPQTGCMLDSMKHKTMSGVRLCALLFCTLSCSADFTSAYASAPTLLALYLEIHAAFAGRMVSLPITKR